MIIAIDGPAGSGKSTVAKRIARELDYTYLDTGAMYRAVALRTLASGMSEPMSDADKRRAIDIARTEPIAFPSDDGGTVTIGGIDVTKDIRTKAVDRAVSPVSAIPEVRAAMTAQQRAIGATCDIVMEGRDIGTVVFPEADVKLFLTASPEARARRRCAQNAERGIGSTDEAEILADILKRDELDSHRAAAPLCKADDAVLLDTSDMTLEEVCAFIVDLVGRTRGEES